MSAKREKGRRGHIYTFDILTEPKLRRYWLIVN
jgi:hypothetical protein